MARTGDRQAREHSLEPPVIARSVEAEERFDGPRAHRPALGANGVAC